MISAISWVPRGACKNVPVVTDPPSKEEIEEIKSYVLERSGDGEGEEEEEDEDDQMDVDASKGEGEVSQALAAAEALGKTQGGSRFGDPQGIADALRELDMDNYDEEDEGIDVFSKGLGDAYYPSNDMDPYLKKNNDDDDDDDASSIEDMNIEPADSVIVCAKSEEYASELEVYIIQELEDGQLHTYVHHAIMVSAFPLCTAWLDCNLKSGDKGNFIAVGSMEPAIEIWDLDLLGEVQPFMVLGGISEKKRKGKQKSVKYKKGSHRGSVLDLAWNKEVRNVLASASADKSVRVWDMVTGDCVVKVEHHKKEVQAIAWNTHSPQVLLSGSFDQTVLMLMFKYVHSLASDIDFVLKIDVRENEKPSKSWSLAADVESLAWDPHNEHSFVVSLENNTVQGFDTRATATDSSSSSKPTFTLDAHDKAVTSISYSPSVANLLATGSMDNMVKLWDLSNNQPSCVASKNPEVGAIFSLSFSADIPFALAIGGSKGSLEVWDTLSAAGVAHKFGRYSNRRTNLAL